ncbi:hypothetical protein B0H14DRAFT_2800016 [Mycena olivaceomarginata]|nr:hypothetical protein B0H14DRAFT_2800016 [Mycena olivaceomarginata]
MTRRWKTTATGQRARPAIARAPPRATIEPRPWPRRPRLCRPSTVRAAWAPDRAPPRPGAMSMASNSPARGQRHSIPSPYSSKCPTTHTPRATACPLLLTPTPNNSPPKTTTRARARRPRRTPCPAPARCPRPRPSRRARAATACSCRPRCRSRCTRTRTRTPRRTPRPATAARRRRGTSSSPSRNNRSRGGGRCRCSKGCLGSGWGGVARGVGGVRAGIFRGGGIRIEVPPKLASQCPSAPHSAFGARFRLSETCGRFCAATLILVPTDLAPRDGYSARPRSTRTPHRASTAPCIHRYPTL